jgi:hypothetical protein
MPGFKREEPKHKVDSVIIRPVRPAKPVIVPAQEEEDLLPPKGGRPKPEEHIEPFTPLSSDYD